VITHVHTVKIKTGEELEIIRVAAPDAQWKEPIIEALQHKGEAWVSTIRVTLEQSLEGVQCYHYLGLLGGEIAGNITTTEATEVGVGILSHVFTNPSHRRKGICTALMETVTRDFTARGGRAMTLSTIYDSPAYHIYHRFGFAGIGTSGRMIWQVRPGFLDDYFAADSTDVADISWPDWPRLDLLYTIPSGSFLRGLYHHHYGPSSYEGCSRPRSWLNRGVKSSVMLCWCPIRAGTMMSGYSISSCTLTSIQPPVSCWPR